MSKTAIFNFGCPLESPGLLRKNIPTPQKCALIGLGQGLDFGNFKKAV